MSNNNTSSLLAFEQSPKLCKDSWRITASEYPVLTRRTSVYGLFRAAILPCLASKCVAVTSGAIK